MKYKHLPAMAHNLTHSFMSAENYVDGSYVFEELQQLARDNPGHIISIHWVPESDEETSWLPPCARKSIGYYRGALSRYFENHRIEPSAVRVLRTEIFLAPNRQIHTRSVVVDDRGKEHVQLVWSA